MRLVLTALVLPAGGWAGRRRRGGLRAPGRGGVNHSLTYAAIELRSRSTAAEANWYQVDEPRRRAARPEPHAARTVAWWLTGAGWSFNALAGTEITRLVSWRYGEARDFGDDDPDTPLVDESDHWRADVADGQREPDRRRGPAARRARTAAARPGTIGALGGARRDHRLATKQLRWQISRVGEIVGGCPTAYADPVTAPGYLLATVAVYATQITLNDPSAPAATLGGPVVGPGWHRPPSPRHYRRRTTRASAARRADGPSAGRALATSPTRVPCLER